jgi:uncharacterized protein (TIGR03083 family)
MLQTRDTITKGFRTELDAFSELVRDLDENELARPSRCEGWTVGDVAGHFIGSIAEIAAGQLDGQGTPEVTERQTAARRGWTGKELAVELDDAAVQLDGLLNVLDDAAWNAPAGGGFDGTLGEGVEALWFDAVVHSLDIADGLGRPQVAAPAGLLASVSHVAMHLDRAAWGPATLALTGLDPAIGDVVVGSPEPSSPRIEADALAFVLAGTGRLDPSTLGLDETVDIYRG